MVENRGGMSVNVGRRGALVIGGIKSSSVVVSEDSSPAFDEGAGSGGKVLGAGFGAGSAITDGWDEGSGTGVTCTEPAVEYPELDILASS